MEGLVCNFNVTEVARLDGVEVSFVVLCIVWSFHQSNDSLDTFVGYVVFKNVSIFGIELGDELRNVFAFLLIVGVVQWQ